MILRFADDGPHAARAAAWAFVLLAAVGVGLWLVHLHGQVAPPRSEAARVREPAPPPVPPAVPAIADTRPAPPAAAPPAAVPPPSTPPPPRRPTVLSPVELFRKSSPAVAQVIASMKDIPGTSQGSGFFVSADGLLVTNFHVIQGANRAHVVTADGRKLAVEGVAAFNTKADLALLKVDARGLPHLRPAAAAPPGVGTHVYAIGNPKGLTNTLSDGMISGLRATPGDVHFLQTTAPISPGSSGGPLLTADSSVVGVTTATVVGGQNLNLATPAAEVRKLLDARTDPRPLAEVSGQRVQPAPTELKEAAHKALFLQRDLKAAGPLIDQLTEAYPSDPAVWFLSAVRWEMQAAADRDEALLDRAYEDYGKVYDLDPDSEAGKAADKRMYELRTR